MKIVATLAGILDHHRELEWPEGWPVPREGEGVTLPQRGDSNDTLLMTVKRVIWFPEGDVDGSDPEPFVYLVIVPYRS